MAIEDYYNKKVIRVTLSTGSWGTTATRTTIGSFLAAFNPQGSESYAGNKKTVFYDASFYCSANQTLNHKDVLLIDSQNYNIVLIKNTFEMNHHKKVLLKRQA